MIASTIRVMVVALVVMFAGVSAAAFNLDSLLVVSVGGPAARDSLQRLTSLYTAGTVDINGLQGRFEQYFVPPDRFFVELNFTNFSLVQAYDGWTAWQQDHNGQISRLEGFEKRELLKNAYFESCSYLLPDRLPGSIKYLGQTTRDEQVYHEVAFYPLDRDTVVAYYDLDRGLRKLMFARLDNFNTVTTIDDYRSVAGILIPFYSRTIAEGADLTSELAVDSVAVNQPVDMTIFTMPSAGTVDYLFPEGIGHVRIPIQYQGGHIRLAATINGTKKARFILDSGASANLLHQPLTTELQLPIVGALPARGLGGISQIDLVRTDSISIGKLTLYNQVAGSIDLSLLNRPGTDREAFGGLLGYDFLSRFPVLVSYRDSMLTVFNPQQFAAPEGGVEIGFHLTMLVPTIRGELNGIPGDFLVDLGNTLGLIIHRDFAHKHQLDEKLDDVRDNPTTLSGIGGRLSGQTAYAAVFKMGDILLQSLRVILPDSSAGLSGSNELAGNIGNMVLENFDLLLDYRQARLILYRADKE
ncbi:MAG: aspartyl protease family protein [bacterium]